MTDEGSESARPLTLLFTDVEGSTRLVDRHQGTGTEALMRHHAIVQGALEAHDGRRFEQVGDAAYAVFEHAADAIAAATDIHARLAQTDWGEVGRVRVRIGLDSGHLEERGGRFVGRALFRCARIQALAGGGETLLSDATAELVREAMPAGHRLRDLGAHRLRGLRDVERVWAVVRAPDQRRVPGQGPIRILLVDDYEVVRRGLRGFLELVPDFEIVGEASNGMEAVDAAYRLEPDVVLMDLVMPEMDGPDAIAAIRARQPQVACVALTSFTEPERITRALEAGAARHLLKDADADEVVKTVRAAHADRASPAGEAV